MNLLQNCLLQVDIVHQDETIPPTPLPITTIALLQGDQGQSNSNFETTMISQLSLFVHLTQVMVKRLTKVERDVATMKRLTNLDNGDDDMVFDNTPPNSLGDNPPPPPPPSTNLPPPSHPPPRTHSPPPNSPPQSDAAKNAENNQGDPQSMKMQVVIVPTPSQLEMIGKVEAENEIEKLIVATDVDATTNQPIPDTGDQLETGGYEGFLDLGFMQHDVVFSIPLNVVYVGSCFEREIS
ncbi:unnamed protein product [Lactuca saligna]|uniref:Uncharacterized protein n=1 Tax=Lactuca saligna TaxID=75948 RepID=A0AA36EB61_LACSI|nr:unnamed protein product [Lactuca saligna]